MIIACSDSRVDPATILGLNPGEAFMVRNVANMVPAWEPTGGYPSVSSALEYAVKHLKVEHIVVIGHRLCGGIKALVTTEPGTVNQCVLRTCLPVPFHCTQNLATCIPFPLTSRHSLLTLDVSFGSDFIESWLSIGGPARAVTKAVAGGDDVDEQCKFCEKVRLVATIQFRSHCLAGPVSDEACAVGLCRNR